MEDFLFIHNSVVGFERPLYYFFFIRIILNYFPDRGGHWEIKTKRKHVLPFSTFAFFFTLKTFLVDVMLYQYNLSV